MDHQKKKEKKCNLTLWASVDTQKNVWLGKKENLWEKY